MNPTADTSRSRFSGLIGFAPWVVPPAILVAVPALSYVYAAALVWFPARGLINLFLVVAFGLSLGWVVGRTGFLARCRSLGYLRAMGLAAGLLGIYVSWACFEYQLAVKSDPGGDLSLVELLGQPRAVFAIAAAINAEGWYTLRGFTPSGGLLWLMWGVEAASIVGLAMWASTRSVLDRSFCEPCQRWCSRVRTLHLPSIEGPRARDAIVANDVKAILALPGTDQAAGHLTRIDLDRCARCLATATASVRNVEIDVRKRWRIDIGPRLLDHEEIAPATCEALIRWSPRLAPGSAPAGVGVASRVD